MEALFREWASPENGMLWLFAAVGGYCAIYLLTRTSRRRRTFGNNGTHFRRASGRYWPARNNIAYLRQAPPLLAANNVTDATKQLGFVMAASFHKKKVMSKAEYRVFQVVEEQARARNRGYRVLSQTSLGEVIGSDDDRAFFAINSKRVDILIISSSGHPVAAIEYQGGMHHQGDAAARDAVKKEALRKAGVHYVEVLESHGQSDIARMVQEVLSRP